MVLLDLTPLSAFTDFFVIATADNERQLNALVDAVQSTMKEHGRAGRPEGIPSDGWVLLDLGEVIVHLFSVEKRDYYDIEGLWARAQQVVRIQ